MRTYELAVIGLGAVGGAALLAAARAGVDAIGFDRFDPPHMLGSTHGETRIVREAIGEGAIYTPFARRSFELWAQLEAETGRVMAVRCGALILGGVLPHAMHVAAGFLETTIAAARTYGVPHEVLTGAEVRSRFPAFANFEGGRAYFEPGAGYGRPEMVVAAQVDRARELGATVRVNMPILQMEPNEGTVVLVTPEKTIRARQAILCAGAWTRNFLPPDWSARLTVTRQVMHWFDPGPEAQIHTAARMPVFIWNDLYGFPSEGTAAGIKIATETLDHATTPEAVDRTAGAADRASIDAKVRAAFPRLGSCTRSAVCLYTATPDFDFLVARHPRIERVLVVSACGGHGFKHAPAVGEAVVNEALGLSGMRPAPEWGPARLGI